MAVRRKPITDRSKLAALLSRNDIVRKLKNLRDLSLYAEVPNVKKDKCKELGPVFCDGFILKLG